jgi:hypothetical protein
MITAIIFSKDRPLQLDLCLNSILKNFTDCTEIIVIHKYDTNFIECIEILDNEYKDVSFKFQSESIYKDLYLTCEHSKNNYICFFTDDDIFYEKFSTNLYDNMFHPANQVCTLSLRLGLNTTKRYHQGELGVDEPYKKIINGNFLVVPKTSYGYGSYWSYSHSLDGHIFTKNDMLKVMDELSYLDEKFKFDQTPNEVETQMQRYWPLSYNNIVCPLHSVVVNSPNNRVSDTHIQNASGEQFDYTPEYLLGIFRAGKRINIDYLDFRNIDCPHKEINIMDGI